MRQMSHRKTISMRQMSHRKTISMGHQWDNGTQNKNGRSKTWKHMEDFYLNF